jgi:hypothetical protein
MLKKIAPPAKIKRMISSRMGVKRTALAIVDAAAETEIGLINKKKVLDVAIKTIAGYQQRIEAATSSEVRDLILDDPKQLIQRVQNEFVFQAQKKLQEQYKGQRARWLPSSADEPDPEHQKNYGKEYEIGEGIDGEEPGDRFGCKCGVEILNQPSIELE